MDSALGLSPVKGGDLIDMKQFHNRQVKIEKIEKTQLPSLFTPLKPGLTITTSSNPADHVPQWVMKVSSEVIHTYGEGDSKIEFRASEMFNLKQDEKGELKGYSTHKDAKITKFMADVGAKTPDELIGKMATVKAYDKDMGDGRTASYLKFKY